MVHVQPVHQPITDRLAGPRTERVGRLHHGGRRRRRMRLRGRAAEQPEPGQQPGPAHRDDRGEQRGAAHRPRLGGLPVARLPAMTAPIAPVPAGLLPVVATAVRLPVVRIPVRLLGPDHVLH